MTPGVHRCVPDPRGPKAQGLPCARPRGSHPGPWPCSRSTHVSPPGLTSGPGPSLRTPPGLTSGPGPSMRTPPGLAFRPMALLQEHTRVAPGAHVRPRAFHAHAPGARIQAHGLAPGALCPLGPVQRSFAPQRPMSCYNSLCLASPQRHLHVALPQRHLLDALPQRHLLDALPQRHYSIFGPRHPRYA
jgi:hypothetical protein